MAGAHIGLRSEYVEPNMFFYSSHFGQVKDHDTQNLANTSWAAAMVGFRYSRWLDACARKAVEKIQEMVEVGEDPWVARPIAQGHGLPYGLVVWWTTTSAAELWV